MSARHAKIRSGAVVVEKSGGRDVGVPSVSKRLRAGCDINVGAPDASPPTT